MTNMGAPLGSQTTTGDSLSIALVESSDLENVRHWTPSPKTYSNRVSSITNASRQFLHGMHTAPPQVSIFWNLLFNADIGAWENVDESRTAPIEHMEVGTFEFMP